MDKTTAILTAIFTAAFCLPVIVALIILGYDKAAVGESSAVLYNKNNCLGIVKDVVVEDGHVKIVTSKGIFVYDEDGNLVKEYER